jgi:nicotinamide phosphoribosyltransferase
MANKNVILATDSYKFSQYAQYPEGSEEIFEYLESRGGRFPETLFIGLQPLLSLFAERITQAHVEAADRFVSQHIGPNVFYRKGWEYIVNKLDGKLPIRIRAVPEGTVVPVHNILASIESTDDNCAWVPGPLETQLIRAIWYPTTVGTLSYTVKKTIRKYLELTGDVNLLPFKFHDFGARGVSSAESAAIGGMAHLVNFMGTDTVEGILYAQEHYLTQAMIGFSIVASEHSTMTSWGGPEGEIKAMKNLIDRFLHKDATVACVSDSFSIYNAIIQHWGTTLKDQIVKSGGTLVIRPDSGDPVQVTLECVQLLGEKFGYSVNDKGYKVLHPAVRLIQGDGIDDVMVEKILANFAKHSWSADNIAFGCGGGLLQKVNRDTQKFAVKASAIRVNGAWRDVYKDPITDPGKMSKKGRLTLLRKGKQYVTVRIEDVVNYPGYEEVLQTVFENGEIKKQYTFEEVRANSNK